MINHTVSNYIEQKLRDENITKKKLYIDIVNYFHKDKEDYLSYKGFVAKFYNNSFTADDLLEISTLLNFDLNQIRSTILEKKIYDLNNDIERFIKRSKYSNLSKDNFSSSLINEDNFAYLIWYKNINTNKPEFFIEEFNLSSNKVIDITYLNSVGLINMSKDWEVKSFKGKLLEIKKLNLMAYQNLTLK